MSALAEHVKIAAELHARLSAMGAADEETVHDMIEGETELLPILEWMAREARHAAAMQKAVADMMSEMAGRKRRFEAREESLRRMILWAMQEAGLSRHEAADITLSVSPGRPSLVIGDEQAIPLAFKHVSYTLDRTAIKKAIADGQEVPGAALSNGAPHLSMRVA